MEREMSVLGAQTFQAQKWPAGGFHGDAERRKAMKRPALTLENADAIRQHVSSVDIVGSRDLGFRLHGVVQRREHEPQPLDLRGHAEIRPTTRTTSAWGGTSHRWT